jgi:hypothetical protein
MRVYVPADVAAVRTLVSAGTLPGSVAHAVTDALRAAFPHADEEELEYRALLEAADDSADRTGGGRRVVLAVDVAPAAVGGRVEGSATAVRLTGDVPVAGVAAAHVDETDAGDPDERDLLWYAPQELADWLAELAGPGA